MNVANLTILLILEVLAVAIPVCVTVFVTHRLNKSLKKRDEAAEERERCRKRESYLMLKNIKAIGGVAEKIAVCVKNDRVNGDMDEALEYEQDMKHELQDFLDEQAMKYMN